MAFRVTRLLLGFFAAVTFASTAHAQLFRAYLSSSGIDSAPCTLPQPCRLLPAALAAVQNGGEIWILDPANYNTASVAISKSVTILAVPGVIGSVVATGGPALSISGSGNTVVLRNLVVRPLSSSGATYGITMTGSNSLHVEDSVVANLPFSGIYVSGAGMLKVINSIIRNAGDYGIRLDNGVSASISTTRFLDNTDGAMILLSDLAVTTRATVSDSTISGHGTGSGVGLYALTNHAQGSTKIFVTRSTITSTQYALHPRANSGPAEIALSGSAVTSNAYGWYLLGAAGAVVRSYGNNHFGDNPGSLGSLTSASLQ